MKSAGRPRFMTPAEVRWRPYNEDSTLFCATHDTKGAIKFPPQHTCSRIVRSMHPAATTLLDIQPGLSGVQWHTPEP